MPAFGLVFREAWREVTRGTVEERRAKLADLKRRPALKRDPSGLVTGTVEEIFIHSVQRPDLKALRLARRRMAAGAAGGRVLFRARERSSNDQR